MKKKENAKKITRLIDEDLIDGLSSRHVAQIIRRKTITKIKPSGKVYKRNRNSPE